MAPSRIAELKPKDADVIVALHYAFYWSKTKIVLNRVYDAEKSRLLPKSKKLRRFFAVQEKRMVGDYPNHIRSLAYYMLWKHMTKTGEWNNDVLPYGWREPIKQR
jgi:hypothetical protein